MFWPRIVTSPIAPVVAASGTSNQGAADRGAPLQHDPTARIASLQTSSTGGRRASPHRVAGFATSTGSAGHAGLGIELRTWLHQTFHSVALPATRTGTRAKMDNIARCHACSEFRQEI